MARTNYPEELTALVEAYLTDGAISGKERQVLLKKAEKLGIDVDEFDLYIDAQIQKIDLEADNLIRKAKGKACPYCGKPVPQLAEQCPHCGQFITAEASEELKEILENLEDALEDVKCGYDVARNKARVEKYTRKARMYYSSHPKIKAILAEVDQEISAAASAARKQALIKCIQALIKCIQALIIGILVLINSAIKNKWFWCAVSIVFGIIFLLIGFCFIDDDYSGLVIGLIGFAATVGGVRGIIEFATRGDE